jgi:hypothetical protein
MANEEHLAILRQGVKVWNAWREEHRDGRPDLREADLCGAILGEANLYRASLSKANLSRANLSRADLREADLMGADLREADLMGADLNRAYLRRAHLSKANLSRVNLSRADLIETNLVETHLVEAHLFRAHLREANLSQAIVESTIFTSIDLSTVNGLDSVQHYGPSAISTDTLIKSKGNIPEVFLRGCGVPDSFIEYLPSLLGAMQPLQFYSCFISYSSKDEDFAQRLWSRMRDHHLHVWFAPEDIKGGRKLHEQIEEAIRVYDKLVVVLSKESIQSEWVQQELRRARRAELRDKRRKLFPIRLVDFEALQEWECQDSSTGSDLAEEIRQYFISDFTRWKEHDAFEREFARLLRDLKAVDALPAQPLPPPAPPKASTQPEQAIIEIKQRRLAILEEQRAQKGYNAPPELIMEIEDLRREIAELGSQ